LSNSAAAIRRGCSWKTARPIIGSPTERIDTRDTGVIKLQFRDQPERFIGLTSRSLTIGRDESNDLVIDEPSISDFHSEIINSTEGLTVIDLVSATGTYVNEERVRNRRQLKTWDVLRLGNVELEVHDPSVHRPSDWALRSRSDLLAQQYFTLGPVTVIGRGAECDLTIDDAMLSRRHAQIEILGEVVRIRDLGSANGTFVNDVRINRALLQPDDAIQIGSRSFILVAPTDLFPAGSSSDEDLTVMPGSNVRALDNIGDVPTELITAGYPKACLIEESTVLGNGAQLTLDGTSCRVGRTSDNDIVIPDVSVSRLHATLRVVGNTWRIEDAHSSNGVIVNGTRTEAANLRDGDVIKLGRLQFRFCCNPA